MTPSTYFALMAEFGSGHIPVTEIGKKYFDYDEVTSKRKAAKNDYPFPVFKVGNQKTVWMVDIADFASFIDSVRDKAKKEYNAAK